MMRIIKILIYGAIAAYWFVLSVLVYFAGYHPDKITSAASLFVGACASAGWALEEMMKKYGATR